MREKLKRSCRSVHAGLPTPPSDCSYKNMLVFTKGQSSSNISILHEVALTYCRAIVRVNFWTNPLFPLHRFLSSTNDTTTLRLQLKKNCSSENSDSPNSLNHHRVLIAWGLPIPRIAIWVKICSLSHTHIYILLQCTDFIVSCHCKSPFVCLKPAVILQHLSNAIPKYESDQILVF